MPLRHLRETAFLRAFPMDVLIKLSEEAPRLHPQAGEVIFPEGAHEDTMYAIIDGRVRIHRIDEEGDTIELGILEEGQVFGELALLSSEPRMATATAYTDCELMLITRDIFHRMIDDASSDQIIRSFAALSHQIRATNERDFERLLKRRTLEAQMEAERQRSLTQLVAGVAHELNTPLGVINTAASILAREFKRPQLAELADEPQLKRIIGDMQEALHLITGNVERAHRLVQDFKKVSISQLTDVKENLNLPQCINEIISISGTSLRHSGVKIEFSHDLIPEDQAWVGYQGYLSQVLLNLLGNIERYAYDAGGVAEIKLQLGDDNEFELTVRDYGKGMADEHAQRIFEPFYTTGRNVGGSGLGLAIVYNLVTEALQGSITVESQEGEGTVFTVTFPRVIE